MTYRDLTRWKSWFYGALLPALGRVPPHRADQVLAGLGRLTAAWPGRRAAWRRSIEEARDALGAPWQVGPTLDQLIDNSMRFAARDYLLHALPSDAFQRRFDVRGFETVRQLLDRGQGVILLGCHLGGYLAAIHWLHRQAVPVRLLVQRPRHVSHALQAWFDADGGPVPQRDFFLRTGMSRADATRRVLLARDALRAGQAVYLNGDIPWPSCNARPGRLLGRAQEFLSIWVDLAAVTAAPVVPLFCTHRPEGRFDLQFDHAGELRPGDEANAVQRYLRRLEQIIAAHPADAIPHLTWSAYRQPTPARAPRRARLDRPDGLPPAPARSLEPGRAIKTPNICAPRA